MKSTETSDIKLVYLCIVVINGFSGSGNYTYTIERCFPQALFSGFYQECLLAVSNIVSDFTETFHGSLLTEREWIDLQDW